MITTVTRWSGDYMSAEADGKVITISRFEPKTTMALSMAEATELRQILDAYLGDDYD